MTAVDMPSLFGVSYQVCQETMRCVIPDDNSVGRKCGRIAAEARGGADVEGYIGQRMMDPLETALLAGSPGDEQVGGGSRIERVASKQGMSQKLRDAQKSRRTTDKGRRHRIDFLSVLIFRSFRQR
jgi:hypothetical protein